MSEGESILSLDLGGNIKYTLVDVDLDNQIGRILTNGQFQVQTFNEAVIELKHKIQNVSENVLSKLRYVLLSFPAAFSFQYKHPHKVLEEIITSFKKYFGRHTKTDISFLLIGRDGEFYDAKTVINLCSVNYKEMFFFFDSYWRGAVEIARDIFGLSSFLYLDMGSFSFSIIPIVNGNIKIERYENRIYTNKLLAIGMKHTPILLITNEINLEDASFKPYAYVPLFTADIFASSGSEQQLLKVSKFLGYPVIKRREALKTIQYIKDSLSELVNIVVENILTRYFTGVTQEIPVVLAGDGKNLLFDILCIENTKKLLLPMDNTHTSLGITYTFLKSIGVRITW